MTIKVLRGDPTAEELAAVLAVLYSRGAQIPPGHAGDPHSGEPRDRWADKTSALPNVAMTRPGPTAWRSTYWPH